MTVVKDLILVRQVRGVGECWQPAKKGDEGIFVVSEQVYKEWSALDPEERTQGLREYNKEKSKDVILISAPLDELLRLPEKERIASQQYIKEQLERMKMEKSPEMEKEEDIELPVLRSVR